LTGYAAIKILGPAFYALDDARTPMRVSLLSVGINLAGNWLAVSVLGLGHGGLAVSTSTVALWNSALLYLLLRRKVGGRGFGILSETWRVAAATLAMGVLCAAWLTWLRHPEPTFARSLMIVATTVPLGILVFYGAGRALGVGDLERATALLRRRLLGR
jgi:putative peptidoglycan lipid II flippase